MFLHEWIAQVGVVKVAEVLGVNPSNVSNWKTFRAAPKPEIARLIIDKSCGLVSYEEIYEPFYACLEGREPNKPSKK